MSFNFKTFFDFICSFLGILTLWWVILIAWLIATIETRSNGFFIQKRIGKNGKLFSLIKIKTMSPNFGDTSSITTSNDERITKGIDNPSTPRENLKLSLLNHENVLTN